MLYRRIISQLITVPIKHVSTDGTMLKLFCVHRCPSSSRLISTSRFPGAGAGSSTVNMPSNITSEDDKEMKQLKSYAQTLWDYLRIDSPLKKSDLILVLGNSDVRTAHYAASLYKQGLAPLVVVSGKAGHGTKGKWNKPEAVIFAEQLLKDDVPYEHILVEAQATNTGENIRFTQRLLRTHPDLIQPQSIILVQTPFMGRRTLATFLKQWEQADKVDVIVSSPQILLGEYPDTAAGYSTLKDVAMELVRNMQRIEEYPHLGFQVHQHVPGQVHEAFRSLRQMLSVTASNV